MRKAAALFLLLALSFPGFAYSAGPCGDYEYAELQDMDQESFLKEYCKVRKTGKLYAELSMFGGKRQDKAAFDSCHEVMTKMERIYLKKFKIENREEMVSQCK